VRGFPQTQCGGTACTSEEWVVQAFKKELDCTLAFDVSGSWGFGAFTYAGELPQMMLTGTYQIM